VAATKIARFIGFAEIERQNLLLGSVLTSHSCEPSASSIWVICRIANHKVPGSIFRLISSVHMDQRVMNRDDRCTIAVAGKLNQEISPLWHFSLECLEIIGLEGHSTAI
jgi:hypothetical protein